MKQDFKKALKEAYQIPESQHRDAFLKQLQLVDPPQEKPKRCYFRLSPIMIRCVTSVVTAATFFGVYTFYKDIPKVPPEMVVDVTESPTEAATQPASTEIAETVPETTQNSSEVPLAGLDAHHTEETGVPETETSHGTFPENSVGNSTDTAFSAGTLPPSQGSGGVYSVTVPTQYDTATGRTTTMQSVKQTTPVLTATARVTFTTTKRNMPVNTTTRTSTITEKEDSPQQETTKFTVNQPNWVWSTTQSTTKHPEMTFATSTRSQFDDSPSIVQTTMVSSYAPPVQTTDKGHSSDDSENAFTTTTPAFTKVTTTKWSVHEPVEDVSSSTDGVVSDSTTTTEGPSPANYTVTPWFQYGISDRILCDPADEEGREPSQNTWESMASSSQLIVFGQIEAIYFTSINGKPWTQMDILMIESCYGERVAGDRISVYVQGGYMPLSEYIRLNDLEADFSSMKAEEIAETTWYSSGGNTAIPAVGSRGFFFLRIGSDSESVPHGAYMYTSSTDQSFFTAAPDLSDSVSGGSCFVSVGNASCMFHKGELKEFLEKF